MWTSSFSIFHKLPQRVDCSIWDGHHEPTQILENHSLPLGEFRTQKRTKHILIEGNRTIKGPGDFSRYFPEKFSLGAAGLIQGAAQRNSIDCVAASRVREASSPGAAIPWQRCGFRRRTC